MSKKKRQKKNSLSRFSVLKLILLLLVTGFFFLLPASRIFVKPAIVARQESQASPVPLVPPTPHPIPLKTTTVTPPDLTASGIVIMDADSGTILYEKNPDERLAPASTTKIMTALITLKNYDLEDVVTVKTVITEPQIMGLYSGEKITVENLLLGTMIHSANDAAFALAEHSPGGVTEFVSLMNAEAQKLGLTNTMYANPIGFDDENQYTTSKDLAKLASAALKNKVLTKIVGYPQITVSDTTHTYFHSLKNVNQLLGKTPGVSGLKTGFTQEAGECLVATAERNGHKIVTVLLKSGDRFGETEQLITWAFNNFIWQEVGTTLEAPQE